MATTVLNAAFPSCPVVGVRTSRDPAGALGAWREGASPAICIPDGTRHLDIVSALNALSKRIPDMGPVVIGLGLHRPMMEEELVHLHRFNPIQHDPEDCVPTAVINGIPGAVFRPVAQSSYAISVGVVELHQYAGLSGGHKALSVGCGGRNTIAALHHRDMVTAKGVGIGALSGNPFREAVDDLGQAGGCRLALVYVPAIDRWMFGDPSAVLREALSQMDPWEPIHTLAPGAVLSVPKSKASSFYQASRAATYLALSPHPPVAEGGTIVLRAPCSEGLGSESGFVDVLHDHQPPWQSLLTGEAPGGAGVQRALMLAKLAERYRLVVEGCSCAAELQALGIAASATTVRRPATWLRVPRPFQRLPQYVGPPTTVLR